MEKADWAPIPADQMEEVYQGKRVPRGQQGGGSQGDEEGLDKDSDKEEDQRIKGCTERDTKLFLHHPPPKKKKKNCVLKLNNGGLNVNL